MPGRLKHRAAALKLDVNAIYLASRDPRVPWYAKALAVAVAGYALSSIGGGFASRHQRWCGQFRTQLGAAIDSVEFVKRALDREVPESEGGEGTA